jgi:hypothetical protein
MVRANQRKARTADDEIDVRLFSDLIVKGVDDAGERLIFGIVMRPDVLDVVGDYVDADLVKKTAHDFVASLNDETGLQVQHSGELEPSLDLVESTIETSDGERHGLQVRKNDWTAMVRVNSDEIWEAANSGKLTGFSIGGRGTRILTDTPPETADLQKAAESAQKRVMRKIVSLKLNEFSLVDKPAIELDFVIAKSADHIEKAKRFTPLRRRLLEESISRLGDVQTTLTTLRDDLEAADSAESSEETMTQDQIDELVAKAREEAFAEAEKLSAEKIAKAREEAFAEAEKLSAEKIAKALEEAEKLSAEKLSESESRLTKAESILSESNAQIAKAAADTASQVKALAERVDSLVADLDLVKKARVPSARADGSTVIVKSDEGLFNNLF